MDSQSLSLDFDILSDLAIGIEQNRIDFEKLPLLHAKKLGPLAEAISLASMWPQKKISKFSWLQAGIFDDLIRDIESGKPNTQRTGVATGWIANDEFFNDTNWTGFLIRVSSAIGANGFGKRAKQAIMATFGEFRSNVIEHAASKNGALAAFHANDTLLEIVVADHGRGVLRSIRENSKYANLTDAGRALKLTVTDGVSRHDDPERGYGYSHLFKGLANRFDHIRLRSADHALEVIRENGKPLAERISQTALIPGLFVYARFDKES